MYWTVLYCLHIVSFIKERRVIFHQWPIWLILITIWQNLQLTFFSAHITFFFFIRLLATIKIVVANARTLTRTISSWGKIVSQESSTYYQVLTTNNINTCMTHYVISWNLCCKSVHKRVAKCNCRFRRKSGMSHLPDSGRYMIVAYFWDVITCCDHAESGLLCQLSSHMTLLKIGRHKSSCL